MKIVSSVKWQPPGLGSPDAGQVKVDIEARRIQFSDLVRITGN